MVAENRRSSTTSHIMRSRAVNATCARVHMDASIRLPAHALGGHQSVRYSRQRNGDDRFLNTAIRSLFKDASSFSVWVSKRRSGVVGTS